MLRPRERRGPASSRAPGAEEGQGLVWLACSGSLNLAKHGTLAAQQAAARRHFLPPNVVVGCPNAQHSLLLGQNPTWSKSYPKNWLLRLSVLCRLLNPFSLNTLLLLCKYVPLLSSNSLPCLANVYMMELFI